MHPYMNISIQAARHAGDIIMRHAGRIDTLAVTEKRTNDYVSEVDLKAEAAIIETIHHHYPEHNILSEECGDLNKDSEITWIIDPLDGTTNYLHGVPHYAVSIAVMKNNRLEHGVIYDPVRNDLFYASRGAGARLNDQRIRVSKATKFNHALLGTGFPFRHPEVADRYFATFQSVFQKCHGMRRAGAAALDLAYVAAGKLDGFWEFSLNIWDLAAGVVLIREAGGMISDIKGGEDYLKGGDIVTANPKIFKPLLQAIISTQ